MKRWVIGVGVYLWLAAAPAHAAVVINEVLPNPVGDDTESEWVELYSSEANPVSLEGYSLEDKNGKTMVLSGQVGQWLVIYPQGKINLTNTGSVIKLRDSAGAEIDSFSYGQSSEGKSFGRIPDGGEISTDKLTPTAGTANASAPTPTPTPSPTPSASPEATVEPTVSPTPSATGSVLAAATSSPAPTPVAMEVEDVNLETASVGGPAVETPAASAAPASAQTRKFPSPIIFIVAGAGLLLGAAWPFLRKWYHDSSWLKTLLKGGGQSSLGQE